MHDRNMLWKAHDFLAYARQPRTAKTSIHHPDAGTGPCPLSMFVTFQLRDQNAFNMALSDILLDYREIKLHCIKW